MDVKDNCVVSPGKAGERPNIKTNKILTKVVHHKSKIHTPQVSNCTTDQKMKQTADASLHHVAAKRNHPSQNLSSAPHKKLNDEDQDEDIFERKRADHNYTLEQRSALKILSPMRIPILDIMKSLPAHSLAIVRLLRNLD